MATNRFGFGIVADTPSKRPKSVLAVASRLTSDASNFRGGSGGSGAGTNAL
jgi:hypothetical protein